MINYQQYRHYITLTLNGYTYKLGLALVFDYGEADVTNILFISGGVVKPDIFSKPGLNPIHHYLQVLLRDDCFEVVMRGENTAFSRDDWDVPNRIQFQLAVVIQAKDLVEGLHQIDKAIPILFLTEEEVDDVWASEHRCCVFPIGGLERDFLNSVTLLSGVSGYR